MKEEEQENFYLRLKEKKFSSILSDIKKSTIDLERMIINENTSNSNKSGFPFGFNLANKFSEIIQDLTEKYLLIENIKEHSDIEYVSNHLESLISKTVHNSFFKRNVKDYSDLLNSLYTDTSDKPTSQFINLFTLGTSSLSLNPKTNETQILNNLKSICVNNIPTNLYLIDTIFSNKCNKFSFLKLSDLEINLNQEDLIIITKLKFLYDILKVKSAEKKLSVICLYFKEIINILKDDSFELLVRFTVYFLIKINITQFKSNCLFINIFRLKTNISSEEDFFLSILMKSIEIIDSEFGNYSSDCNIGFIRIKEGRYEERLIEFEKQELLKAKFNKKTILNPITLSKCVSLVNSKPLTNLLNKSYFEENSIEEDMSEVAEVSNTSSISLIDSTKLLSKYFLISNKNENVNYKQFEENSLGILTQMQRDFKEVVSKLRLNKINY